MSGYYHCMCRDCFEIIVGEEGDFCDGCLEAGCKDYQGQERMPQECQRPDAYQEDNDESEEAEDVVGPGGQELD